MDFYQLWAGSPYVNKIIIDHHPSLIAKNLIDKKYDFILVNDKNKLEKIQNINNLNVNLENILGTYYAGFNLNSNSELIKNKEFRKTLNMAVDQQRIINEILNGMAVESKGPFPPGMVNSDHLLGYSYNPTAAKNILATLSSSSKKLRILVRKDDNSILTTLCKKITHFVIEDLKKIGIDCTLTEVSSGDYLTTKSIRNVDLFFSRWISDTVDPDNFIQPLFNPDNTSNFSRYNNSYVTQKLEFAKGLVNPRKRENIYKEIQKTISEDVPWIFLFHPQFATVSKNNLLGIKMNPLGYIKYSDIIIKSTNNDI